jgi:sterol desaturase/sphingolipid hydroxylase (fatty acid hydroxylase superfamily)
VGKLGARYQEWLAFPSMSSEPQRMFDAWFLETFSQTPWWTVPLLWLPLVALAAHASLVTHATPALACGAHAAAGLLLWRLTEYLLHRFVFHARACSYWAITLHFSFHGCHHKRPQDRMRLVFPPLFAAPLVYAIRAAMHAALPTAPGRACALFGGMLAGYIVYDCLHYFTHHAAHAPRWLARARRTHLAHHYADATTSFGVTGDLFDRVFGTTPRAGRTKRRA